MCETEKLGEADCEVDAVIVSVPEPEMLGVSVAVMHVVTEVVADCEPDWHEEDDAVADPDCDAVWHADGEDETVTDRDPVTVVFVVTEPVAHGEDVRDVDVEPVAVPVGEPD